MHRVPSARRAVLLAALMLGLAGCARPAQASTPSYVVFFTVLSAELDEPARAVVAQAARAAQAVGDRAIVGYASPSSSDEAGRILTRLPTQVVADALAAQGVASSRILLRLRGRQGDPGVESRRVEINVSAS